MGRPAGEITEKHAAEVRARARAAERTRSRADEAQLELYKAIRRAARAGASMRAIAEVAGVTKARIQQILNA